MKTICIHLEKGGVGKSSITTQVAYELSKLGKKTLIVDGDKQGHATAFFTETFDGEYSLVNYLKKKYNLDDSIYEVRENLFILGTKLNSDELSRWISNDASSNPFAWQNLKRDAEELGFDFVLFDLPPTINDEYIAWILASCNEIIPIIEPEDLAMDSFANYKEILKKIKLSFNGQFNDIEKIIINKEDTEIKIHKHWVDRILCMPGLKAEFIYRIKKTTTIPNSKAMQMLLSEYSASSKITKEVQRLAKDLIINKEENNG